MFKQDEIIRSLYFEGRLSVPGPQLLDQKPVLGNKFWASNNRIDNKMFGTGEMKKFRRELEPI